jgi:hypothetical protein
MSQQGMGGSYVIDESGSRKLVHQTKDADDKQADQAAVQSPADMSAVPVADSIATDEQGAAQKKK